MKKKTLKSALLLCYAFVVSVYVLPQPGAVEKISQSMTDSIAYLGLSVQQSNDAHQLNKVAATSLLQLGQKAKQDPSFKGTPLFEQVIAVMKKRNDGLAKILTAGQEKLLLKHKTQNIAELQTRMMAAQLDLAEEQVPMVYKCNLRETIWIMQPAEQSATNDTEKRQVIRALKAQSFQKDRALKQILTNEQYAIYEQNKHAMMEANKF